MVQDEDFIKSFVTTAGVLQHTFYKLHASATESNELNITLENNQPGGGHQPQSQLQHQQPRLQSHFDGGQQQQQQQAASSSSSAAGPQQQQQQYELLNQFDAALPNTYPTTIQVRYCCSSQK